MLLLYFKYYIMHNTHLNTAHSFFHYLFHQLSLTHIHITVYLEKSFEMRVLEIIYIKNIITLNSMSWLAKIDYIFVFGDESWSTSDLSQKLDSHIHCTYKRWPRREDLITLSCGSWFVVCWDSCGLGVPPPLSPSSSQSAGWDPRGSCSSLVEVRTSLSLPEQKTFRKKVAYNISFPYLEAMKTQLTARNVPRAVFLMA